MIAATSARARGPLAPACPVVHDRPVSTGPIANLGSLVSQAERLRARALQQMQGSPAAPVADADLEAYGGLYSAAVVSCGAEGAARLDGVDDPDRIDSVARLHRSAGLVEHELLRRLAELRTAPGPAEA